jgi:ATP-dependent 26S proteasome regulatory subunit
MRSAFLTRKLSLQIEGTMIQRLVKLTDGLSFAHLQELLRLSGMHAINDGRDSRSETDLLTAAELIRESNDDARRGFPVKSDLKFGLGYLRTLKGQ